MCAECSDALLRHRRRRIWAELIRHLFGPCCRIPKLPRIENIPPPAVMSFSTEAACRRSTPLNRASPKPAARQTAEMINGVHGAQSSIARTKQISCTADERNARNIPSDCVRKGACYPPACEVRRSATGGARLSRLRRQSNRAASCPDAPIESFPSRSDVRASTCDRKRLATLHGDRFR